MAEQQEKSQQEQAGWKAADTTTTIDLDDIQVGTFDLERGIGRVRPEHLDAQIQAMDRMRKAAVARTSSNQWADFGGKPYLEADGAYAIVSLLGLSLTEPTFERHQLDDGHFQIICNVACSYGQRKIYDFGDCDSFDDFLAGERSRLAAAGATPRAISRAVEVSVRKKALANAVSRAVSAFTGLRGLSWEDLESLGLQRDKASSSIEFKRGGRGGKAQKMTLSQALAMPDGSQVAFGGRCTAIDVKQGNKGEFCRLGIRDGAASAWVTLWKPRPEGLVKGAQVFFPNAKMGSYGGKPNPTASEIEILSEHAVPAADDHEANINPQPVAQRGGPVAGVSTEADLWEDRREQGDE